MLLLGLDPGLRNTGWGVIESDANKLRHIANGVVRSGDGALADRLMRLHDGLRNVIDPFNLDSAAVVETLVNMDAKFQVFNFFRMMKRPKKPIPDS